MSIFTQLTLTKKGTELNASVGVGDLQLSFTTIKVSSHAYQQSEIAALEQLLNVKQTATITEKTVTNSTNVKLSATLNNMSLLEGYYIRTLGLFALDSENKEILYAVSQETSGNCYMPPSSLTQSSLSINLTVTVSNTENVNITVDSNNNATIGQVKERIKNTDSYTQGRIYEKNDLFKYNGSVYLTESQFTGDEVPDFSKVYLLSRKKIYDHFTMEIDGNSNANPSVENGCIKYSGGCENFTKEDWVEWLGYKPCIMYNQGDVECYLDPNNYTRDINGNKVDISTVSDTPRNVMIQHKRIGIMSSTISQGNWIIRCTNDPCDGRYSYSAFENGARACKNIYIGAYNGTISDNKLHSLSGAIISANRQSVSSYRTLAQANGMNYQIMDIKMFSYLRHLFIIQNGTLDGRLSSGYDDNNKVSGTTNEMGLNTLDLTSKWGKWIGMETNCFSEYVDGSYVDSNFRLLIAENDNFNDTGSRYKDCGRIYSLGDGYMGSNVTFSPELGFIPNNTNGTSNTLFHSKTLAIKPSTSMINYGFNIFYNHYTFTPETAGIGITARLCYMSY